MKTKQKFLSVLLVLCMVFSIAPAEVFAANNVPDSVWTDYAATEFAGGTGTKEDPYQVATEEQLAKIAKDVNGEVDDYDGKYFRLENNLDLSAHCWRPIGYILTSKDYKDFKGFIDGNNKTINGLIVDEHENHYPAGFFGNIGNSTTGEGSGAKDLTISDARIYTSEEGCLFTHAGILAGFAQANEGHWIEFTNISVSGTVVVESTDGDNSAGGMIGYADRILAKSCTAENISVECGGNSGGFIGLAGGCDFYNCKASGNVSGTWALGGFVGNSYDQSTYDRCAADVKINGSDWRLGGFAGYVESGSFDHCVAFGDVASTVDGWNPKVGGFIGESEDVTAIACHAIGTVTSASSEFEAGGFVGCYTGGDFDLCSFDNEKNSGLSAAGMGTIAAGVAGDSSKVVLANICNDYYNGHTMRKTDKVEATCTTAGKEAYYTCEVCKNHFEDEAGNTIITDIENYGVIERISHTMQKTDKVEATCTTDGKEAYYTCEVCKNHYEDEAGNTAITDLENYGVIEKTGHTMQKTDKVEATCTTAGKEAYYTCKVCQKHFSDAEGNNEITKLEECGIIPVTEHKAGTEWKHSETSHWNECINNCGEKLNEAAHSYKWVVDKEATATEAGLKHEKCSVCGYEKAAVEIPAIGTTDPTDPQKPQKPQKPIDSDKETTSPQTGDNSYFVLWVSMLLASSGALTVMTLYGRKRRKTE